MLATKHGAAALSVASNTLLIILKGVAGIATGSISILAEAIHSLLDLLAALIAFFSVLVSDRPSDEQHPFGHGKVENISGVVEGGLILVAAGIIIYQAVQRLINGVTLEMVELGIGVMAVSVVVNILVSRHLLKVSRATDSIALEADAAHLTTDIYTSLGVLVGLVVVRLTGFSQLDPIIALTVALLIIKAAVDVIRKAFGGLIDTKLPEAEENIIRSCIMQQGSELVSFHDLRTRKAGSWRYIELHLIMHRSASVEESHRICDCIEQEITNRLTGTNVTIHVEPCSVNCDGCTISSGTDETAA